MQRSYNKVKGRWETKRFDHETKEWILVDPKEDVADNDRKPKRSGNTTRKGTKRK